MSLVTISLPQNADLAVPPIEPGKPSGQNIKQIMNGYSKYIPTWARACNVEYRAGPSGSSVSLIAEGGTIWTEGDPRWPVLLMTKVGPVIKTAPTTAGLKAARWAFSAGPWLVRDGQRCNLTVEIAAGEFTGLSPGLPRERAGVGIRADGALVHVADTSLTLDQLVDRLISYGCRDAIGLDGGGSVCVLDASGRVLLGQATREVCCALVFRQMLEDLQPPPEPKGGDQMIVCIDPGHGGIDPGGVGPDMTLEKTITLYVAKRVKEYLTRAGVKVIMTREIDRALIAGPGGARKEEVLARAAVANSGKADYCVSIHGNTVTDVEVRGSEAFHWPGSVNGKRLAESISRAYGIATGMPQRRLDPAEYWILNYTYMPAALIELGFITNRGDRALLKDPAFLDKAALGIAFGILAMRA